MRQSLSEKEFHIINNFVQYFSAVFNQLKFEDSFLIMYMKFNLINNNLNDLRTVITEAKEHELRLYEALQFIAGLFFKLTIVKMKGPNINI